MRSIRFGIVTIMMTFLALLTGSFRRVGAQYSMPQDAATPKVTGYALKKPVFGGACPRCPWGAMGDVVKAALKPYGWDVQMCYYCAGGPREARIVADAMMAAPPENPGPDALPTPQGAVDFGATGVEFLQAAYLGKNDFAKDPQGPRKHLRMIANIQEPIYYIVAVKANSGITDLKQIVERRLPVKMVVRSLHSRLITPAVLAYYGITEERVKSYGGTLATSYSRDADTDVFIGFGSVANTPEYESWPAATQKYDLHYLELAPDLRAKLAKDFDLQEKNMPMGLFRGVERPIPTVASFGTVIYGRTDMPDEFAYTLAKAMDEHQELLVWTHMNWSYNWRTVWKALDVPLHPGAARYYKERGYMN